MSDNMSRIITFYSYKGGVGRSMAIANVAWLLSTKFHKKVLLVDWDLEAPGLHRFFGLEDHDIKTGLMDLLYDYKNLLRQEKPSLSKNLIDINKYISPIKVQDDLSGMDGSIYIIPAGNFNNEYEKRVNEFNWETFYGKWHGFKFIEYLKEELRKEADIILVDSRTGLTDIGGICTMQLPDVDVLLFALNEQNLSGTESIANKILERSREVAVREKPPMLILVPSRVEIAGGQDKMLFWEEKAAKRLWKYLPINGYKNALRYIKKNNIPYIGDYSYGEIPLAVAKDPLGALAEAFDKLASLILNKSDFQEKEIKETAVEHILKFNILFIKKTAAFLFSKKTLAFVAIILMLFVGWQYYKSKVANIKYEMIIIERNLEKANSILEIDRLKSEIERANEKLLKYEQGLKQKKIK